MLVVFGAAATVVVPAIARPATDEARTAAEIAALLRWTWRESAARGVDARFAMDAESGEFWIGADAAWPLEPWRTGMVHHDHDINAQPANERLITVRVHSTGVATPVRIVVGDDNDGAAVIIPDSGAWPHLEPKWHGND